VTSLQHASDGNPTTPPILLQPSLPLASYFKDYCLLQLVAARQANLAAQRPPIRQEHNLPRFLKLPILTKVFSSGAPIPYIAYFNTWADVNGWNVKIAKNDY